MKKEIDSNIIDDKAGEDYWEDSWSKLSLPRQMDPSKKNIGNTVTRRFHTWFENVLGNKKTTDMTLLEVGCGASAWLPYFRKEFGFNVEGIDYTESGCEQARQMLQNSELHGTIMKSDMFEPPVTLLNKYDVVVSFGLVEHFSDTTETIKAISAFAKPGGLVITSVPYMGGLTGVAQRLLDRAIYDIHEIITKKRLETSNKESGLDVIECGYFISTNFGVCNLNSVKKDTTSWWLRKILLAILARLSMLIWWIERFTKNIPGNSWSSPYTISAAIKKS